MANFSSSDLPPVNSGVISDFAIDTVSDSIFAEMIPTDVYIHESILSPTVEISVTFHDTIHLIKNYLMFKLNKGHDMPNVRMIVSNPQFDIEKRGPHGGKYDAELPLNNFRIYRMDSRRPLNYHMEQYTLHMCSPSIVKNQIYRMSHFYKMQELSKIVDDAMDSVDIHKKNRMVEKTDLKRDYISNNQHPFQVISEITDMAMKDNHAQFLHYMTTENVSGKHYFVSLKKLLERVDKEQVDFHYEYNEKGANENFTNIHNIMTYEFPCDFDTLLDLSGGIIHNKDDHKNHKPSMVSINPFDGGIFLVDGKVHGDDKLRGFGGALNAGAWSNRNNFESTRSFGNFMTGTAIVGEANRPSGVEKYLHKRTENVTFLHRERTELKIVVPFNPTIHAGNLIDVKFFAKRYSGSKNLDFGSGIYLITALTHNVKVGNFGVTTLECIRVKDKSSYYKELRPDHQILPKLLKEKK